MKNKKSVYILLLAVLSIWGVIIYKIFNFASSQEPIPYQTETKPISSFHYNKKIDTVNNRKPFDVNFRDPFAKGLIENENNHKIKENLKIPSIPIIPKTKKKSLPVKEAIVFPEIKYKGIVSDTKNKKKVFMIIINGQTKLMKINAQEQEVFLEDGDRESIEIVYKGETRIILIDE